MDKDVIYMYIMDKDVMIYIIGQPISGILLSQKWNLTFLDNMDGSRSYYAKWNVRQMPLWSHLYVESTKQNKNQNENRLIDTKNKQVIARGRGWEDKISEWYKSSVMK